MTNVPSDLPLRARAPRLARVLFAAAALAALAGCGRQPPPGLPKLPTTEVTTLKVVPQDVPVSAEYVAQTQSSQAVNIAARVSGFLDKRVYDEGSVVKAGQVLFQMDPKPFQTQVDGAQAALSRQQAAYDVASANLKRVQPLVEQNALSQKDLDDAKGQFEQAGAAVEQAKSQLEEAKLNLSYTTITTPVTGVSSYAAVADGTYVNAQNSQLTTVSVLTPMWINFSISENEYERVQREVREGKLRLPPTRQFAVEIVLVDGSTFPSAGRITFADPSYNPQTGTFLLRASVENPQGLLRPNQFVRTRLHGSVRPNAILVPQRAVQQSAKGHFVWVLGKSGEAELRPVVVGDWNGDNWFIAQGLAAGDEVIVDGTQRLAPSTPVKVKSTLPTILSAHAVTAAATANGSAKGGTPAPLPAAGAAAPAAGKTNLPVPPAAGRSPSPGSAGAVTAAPATGTPMANSANVSVFFGSGSATLDANAQQLVRSIVSAQMASGPVLEVTGYVDRRGDHAVNVELARRRAVAVRDALFQAGMPGDRVRLKPPADIVGGARDAEARRVDIVLAR
jgi:membrane fusion protein (multidrug efflux system)